VPIEKPVFVSDGQICSKSGLVRMVRAMKNANVLMCIDTSVSVVIFLGEWPC
jgi:hypothetical protein